LQGFIARLFLGAEIHMDEIHKTQEECNGAGTFGVLVTLKKHE